MKANHADFRTIQRIASKYYDLNIGADGALIWTTAAILGMICGYSDAAITRT